MTEQKLFLVLVIGLCILLSCAKKQEQIISPATKLKVAFVYVGPIGDGGWTYAHEQGRLKLQETFPDIETSYIESVKEGPDAERVITQYAENGYKIIFTTSFGYMDPTINVASKYPDVVFMHCSGYKRASNVGTYFGRMEQPKYLAGLMSGKLTKTNIIGYVAPHPIPEVIRLINAFALGVKETNPKAKVHIVWINSWYDPAKEKDAANSLLDIGADIISTGADSPAPLQAAMERGKLSFGYDSDYGKKYAPTSYVTAPIWDWSPIYIDVVKRVKEGIWSSCDYYWGIESGVVKLATITDLVSEELKVFIEQKTQDIVLGKNKIFTGPIKDQNGRLILKDGVSHTDTELLSMNYFVDNIVGKIPE
ncbi:MAG: BMP family ABC transporter substrate-binding protein [Candidatus Hydrogenedentota bacterium]